jgi:hypothetical protein
MAINVDTVYKTVLLILNKEQRGYMTPDEFNKTATQVQLNIFEQYFDDLNQQLRVPQADFDYSNRQVDLDDKISPFKCLGDCSLGAFQLFSTPGSGANQQFGPTTLGTNLIFGAANPSNSNYTLNNFKLYRQVSGVYVEYTDAYTVVGNKFTIAADLDSADNWKVVANGIFTLPSVDILTNTNITYSDATDAFTFGFYRLGTITFNDIEAERLQRNQFYNIDKSDLTAPSVNFPVYLYESGKLNIKPLAVNSDVQASFLRKPKNVKWAFTQGTVGQYIYDNSGNSVNFELNSSEQVEIITRILFYSGVIIRDPQIVQAAAQEIQQNEINQKS